MGWNTQGGFPLIDLFAAGINSRNGTLIARNPKANRGYTMAGLLILASFGGIAGWSLYAKGGKLKYCYNWGGFRCYFVEV